MVVTVESASRPAQPSLVRSCPTPTVPNPKWVECRDPPGLNAHPYRDRTGFTRNSIYRSITTRVFTPCGVLQSPHRAEYLFIPPPRHPVSLATELASFILFFFIVCYTLCVPPAQRISYSTAGARRHTGALHLTCQETVHLPAA